MNASAGAPILSPRLVARTVSRHMPHNVALFITCLTDQFYPETGVAVTKLNDPIGDAAKIKAALAANMLIRTRADADTVQARADDTSMREAALSGGAQFVSTDYEVPDPRIGPYVVKIPDGTPARCNPVTAPKDCKSHDIENPAALTGGAP